MTLPPLDFGAEKVIFALALPAVAEPIVGAPGTVAESALFERSAPSNETIKNDASLSNIDGIGFI